MPTKTANTLKQLRATFKNYKGLLEVSGSCFLSMQTHSAGYPVDLIKMNWYFVGKCKLVKQMLAFLVVSFRKHKHNIL